MHKTVADLLECPACGSDLAASPSVSNGHDIVEGSLGCVSCATEIPITNGIPRFVAAGSYADSFGLQWNRWRRDQLDHFNGFSLSGDRFYSETRWEPGSLTGRVVLDAGCGAGRFLDIASADGAQVVGVDLSSAVDAARESVGGRPNVDIVQASILDLPFKPGVFDDAYCIGVIQHTPEPTQAIREVAAQAREGGRVAFTIYERRRWTHLYPKYWLRSVTTRLPPYLLLLLIRLFMPFLFVASELTFRIPGLGRVARFLIPVANYVGANQRTSQRLDLRRRYTWALMDMFDMFAPAYDFRQTEEQARAAMASAGLTSVSRQPESGLALGGVRD